MGGMNNSYNRLGRRRKGRLDHKVSDVDTGPSSLGRQKPGAKASQ